MEERSFVMEQTQYIPEVLYEDAALCVCVKAPGLLSESGSGNNLPDLLSAYYQSQSKPDFIATVHRLDRIVGGLMVFSRDPKLTGTLVRAIAERQVQKDYYAVLRGVPEEAHGTLDDLLFRDASKNKTYVVDRMRRGVRPARLEYRVIETVQDGEQPLTLVRIRLHTGRTHQIRAQFASRRLPLLGDIRYGSKDSRCEAALWSCALAFHHPADGRKMNFYRKPPEAFPWTLFTKYSAPSPFLNETQNEVTP